MAGYVKLLRSIWTDPDFIALTVDAQRLYMLLMSQDNLSHVGVLPLTPGRFSGLAGDTNTANIRLALTELEAARFIIIDETAEEIWVRSYITHDEAFKLTNGKKSLVNAYAEVFSKVLRPLIRAALTTVGVTVESTVNATVEVTVELSQQPAALILKPSTSSSSQQPSPLPDAPEAPPLELVPNHDAAAAAIDAFIAFKITKDDVGSPVRLQAKLRSTVPDEYGPALTAYLHRRPATDERELLRRVFLLNPANTEKALNEARKMTGAA